VNSDAPEGQAVPSSGSYSKDWKMVKLDNIEVITLTDSAENINHS
jgi:hypothetical protein